MKMGKMPKAKATVKPAKVAPKGSKAPAESPLAPPGLAPKMRGLSKMPRMMRKGGKVKAC
jgi:hypothetical protein